MSLDGAMSVAAGGLANIEHRLGVVSRNIANASTPDYAAEIATQRAVTANGTGLGVLSGASVRALDAQLQAAAFAREGEVGELSTISA